MKHTALLTLAIFCFWVIPNAVFADGIRLEQTRVIFKDDANNQSVTVSNDESSPYLIQAGVTTHVDGGRNQHFVVTPPLFRIDAKSKFTLRIFLKNKSGLPANEESIFYLSTRAIPATNVAENSENNAKLVFVTNIIIKLIYRPNGLEVPDDSIFKQVNIVYKEGQWQFINPTPYYMTLVNIHVNNKPYKHSVLIAPFSLLPIEGFSGNITQGQWQMLNDYGGLTSVYMLASK